MTTKLGRLVALAALGMSGAAHAGWYNDGKVLLTDGVNMADGAGGGGAVPWAVIAGKETRDGVNGSVHYTYAHLPDYDFHSYGVAIGFFDRFELSYANDTLPTGATYDTVGLANRVAGATPGIEPWNTTVKMNVYGAKVRVFGEAIYDSDNLIPQLAVGGFYKKNSNTDLLKTLQANKASDWEAYIAATKIFFPINTAIDVTLRYTSANEDGLTGFGNQNGNKRKIRPEASIAYLLAKDTAIGAEFMKHGRNLSGQSLNVANGIVLPPGVAGGAATIEEGDWYDAFFAYEPNKHISLTMAYLMFGQILVTPHQNGFYFSVQADF